MNKISINALPEADIKPRDYAQEERTLKSIPISEIPKPSKPPVDSHRST
jgi:hypothetical protein